MMLRSKALRLALLATTGLVFASGCGFGGQGIWLVGAGLGLLLLLGLGGGNLAT